MDYANASMILVTGWYKKPKERKGNNDPLVKNHISSYQCGVVMQEGFLFNASKPL